MLISPRNSRRLQRKEIEAFTKLERMFRKRAGRCLNPNCDTKEQSISSHHVSAAHLRYASTDGCVVTFNLPSALINFGKSEPPFGKKSTVSSALNFRGFCSSCDRDLFVEVDNPENSFSKEIAVRQAYRTFAYQYHELMITYMAAQRSRRNMAMAATAFDLLKQDKIAYVTENIERISARFARYSNDLLNQAESVFFQSVDLELERGPDVPLIFSSTFPVSTNFWFGSNDLFPKVSGNQTDVLGNHPDDPAALILLKYGDKYCLSIVGPRSQRIYLEGFWQSIRLIDVEELIFHLLRWSCVCNMGTVISPAVWDSFRSNHPSAFEALEFFAKGVYRGEPFSWRPDLPVPRLGYIKV